MFVINTIGAYLQHSSNTIVLVRCSLFIS